QQLQRRAGDVGAGPLLPPRQRVDVPGDRPVEQPVPARVELDLVDAVAEAVVGDQARLVALGPAATWVTRRGSLRSARRPCAWASAEPATTPASRTRSVAQPPPSRSSASCSGTSAASRSTSSN